MTAALPALVYCDSSRSFAASMTSGRVQSSAKLHRKSWPEGVTTDVEDQ